MWRVTWNWNDENSDVLQSIAGDGQLSGVSDWALGERKKDMTRQTTARKTRIRMYVIRYF